MMSVGAGLNTDQCFTLIAVDVFARNPHFDINTDKIDL